MNKKFVIGLLVLAVGSFIFWKKDNGEVEPEIAHTYVMDPGTYIFKEKEKAYDYLQARRKEDLPAMAELKDNHDFEEVPQIFQVTVRQCNQDICKVNIDAAPGNYNPDDLSQEELEYIFEQDFYVLVEDFEAGNNRYDEELGY
ncbi:hypothetical protein CIB87_02755 [Priestia megaterium]|uniref:Uncharacterized protein n=1 Tax=Priestia megaterium TaxID=1404 RepID=A0AA86IDC3_PRIMG|nr:hypothetical protein [Priestia megaterium]AXI27983.1 hypothetical protein CIB87_02755 [Priestia megaterium]